MVSTFCLRHSSYVVANTHYLHKQLVLVVKVLFYYYNYYYYNLFSLLRLSRKYTIWWKITFWRHIMRYTKLNTHNIHIMANKQTTIAIVFSKQQQASGSSLINYHYYYVPATKHVSIETKNKTSCIHLQFKWVHEQASNKALF